MTSTTQASVSPAPANGTADSAAAADRIRPSTARIKPASILLYGPSKFGKSTQFIRAFGPRGLWIVCERGALWPATNPALNPWKGEDGRIALPRDVVRDPPAPRGAATFDYVECLSTADPYGQVRQAVQEIVLPGVRAGRYAGVVIDGFSEWVDRVWAPISKTVATKEGSHGKAYSNNLYPKVRGIIRLLMEEVGVWLGGVAHERAPGDFEGRLRRGTPLLVGALGDTVPQFFDVVLHCEVKNRERVFLCDPLDRDWVTGDRFGVCGEEEPADLRAVLKRIGARQRGESVEVPVRAVASAAPEGTTTLE